MENRWVLVDGYSVMHAWPKLRSRGGGSLEQRRDALVRVLRQYADHSGFKVTVVFDGYAAQRKPDAQEPSLGVEVLFSGKGQTADEFIERLVGQAEDTGNILVVTSDSIERQTVETMGAHSVTAEMFEDDVARALEQLGGMVRRHSRRRRIGSVGTSFER